MKKQPNNIRRCKAECIICWVKCMLQRSRSNPVPPTPPKNKIKKCMRAHTTHSPASERMKGKISQPRAQTAFNPTYLSFGDLI